MSLLQRQQATVDKLVPIYKKPPGRRNMTAARSANVRRSHVREMMAAGYSQSEADYSAWQCDDMARLEANAQ